MKAVIFFVCICFLLLKWEAPVCATTDQAETCFTSMPQVRANHEISFSNPNPNSTIINGINVNVESEYFIDDDPEEEEVCMFTIPGCSKMMARIHPIRAFPPYPSILNYLCNHFKTPPPFFGVVCDKYILQGVLRI